MTSPTRASPSGGTSEAVDSAPASGAAPVYRHRGAAMPGGEGIESPAGAAVSAPTAPSSMQTGARPGVASGVGGYAGTSRASVESWTASLDRSIELLQTAGARCGDVCRATVDICAASREICELTGDGARDTAMDARCTRARVACNDATRQRDDRCPVCPQAS